MKVKDLWFYFQGSNHYPQWLCVFKEDGNTWNQIAQIDFEEWYCCNDLRNCDYEIVGFDFNPKCSCIEILVKSNEEWSF